jgi:hypothetical protein
MQQPASKERLWPGIRARMGAWWERRTARATSAPGARREERFDVRAALELLPDLLNGAALPNGVVELVIEDLRMPMRRLFDIHDGQIAPVELGSTVPWTSISGSQSAWTLALGPDRDVSQLRHTGEPRLAQRVLAGLGRRCPHPREDEHGYSVLDCS